jgi:hypothetical protein
VENMGLDGKEARATRPRRGLSARCHIFPIYPDFVTQPALDRDLSVSGHPEGRLIGFLQRIIQRLLG